MLQNRWTHAGRQGIYEEPLSFRICGPGCRVAAKSANGLCRHFRGFFTPSPDAAVTGEAEQAGAEYDADGRFGDFGKLDHAQPQRIASAAEIDDRKVPFKAGAERCARKVEHHGRQQDG